jgi:predicted nucleotidyltransferase
MDMYKVKLTKLQQEIFRFFCIHSGETLNQRSVAKELGVSPTAIANSLGALKELLEIQKDPKINFTSIKLNRDNSKSIQLKKIKNLELIYESGLAEFLDNKYPGTTIILFGSYSKGEDTIDSDIDIAIIGTKEKNINLDRFEKLLKRKIILNHYSSFKEIHKYLKENLLNGILIKGGIEL